MGFVFKGPKNDLETGMVNEPSVFEPLKVIALAALSEDEKKRVGVSPNHKTKTSETLKPSICYQFLSYLTLNAIKCVMFYILCQPEENLDR